MATLFKWVGSKSQLVRKYDKAGVLDPIKGLPVIEPFAGNASLSLYLKADCIYLNDLSPVVATVWSTISNDYHHLYKQCCLLDESTCGSSEMTYYLIRDEYNRLIRDPQSDIYKVSALFFYLNRNSYKGVYRVNSFGEYNVPWCGKPKRNFTPSPLILEWCYNHVKMACMMDYMEFIKLFPIDFLRQSVVYFDPPYLNTFNNYTSKVFNQQDHLKLHDLFRYLSNQGVKMMLSNIADPWVIRLYSPYNIYSFVVSETIRQKGNSTRSEILITNYD